MPDKFKFLSKNHIRDGADFDAVFNSKKRLNSPLGVLRFTSNSFTYPRLGIIVSKRNVRFAVARNTLRRIIKEQFRLNQHGLPGYDVVFVAYKQASGASNSEFHQCLSHLFNVLAKRLGGL